MSQKKDIEFITNEVKDDRFVTVLGWMSLVGGASGVVFLSLLAANFEKVVQIFQPVVGK